jgi:hypothetical protein
MADADFLDYVLRSFGIGVWVTHSERIISDGVNIQRPPGTATFGTDRDRVPLTELPEGLLARAARVWMEAAPDEDKEHLRKHLSRFL